MFDGPSVISALKSCGITHVIWVPDSHIGTWEADLVAEPSIQLVRVCREGEAFAVAAGLLLGGKKPVVLIQCTGLFEAGDSLRNFLHDLRLPLFFVVGLRSHLAARQGKTGDTCPRFSEPIMKTWQVPYVVLDPDQSPSLLAAEFQKAEQEQRPGAVLLAE